MFQTFFVDPQGFYLVFNGFILHYCIFFAWLFLLLYCWLALTTFFMVPIDFYYRYRAVVCNDSMSKRMLVTILSVVYILCMLENFSAFKTYKIGPSSELVRETEILKSIDVWRNNVPTFAFAGNVSVIMQISFLFREVSLEL